MQYFSGERAGPGTLFLDEAGDLSLAGQASILRVLQDRADIRLLAATNTDLEAEIFRGNFREDLYYRIKVIHIHVPALREMREEIPLLANHFLKEYCRETGCGRMEFSADVLRHWGSLPWPGNVRQLRNEVRRLAECAQGSLIQEEDTGEMPPGVKLAARAESLRVATEELEREMIGEALRSTGHNQQQAARALGLSRQGLINKMKRYSIPGHV
jgi:DNA-binding NtrC family response regulator